MKHVIQAVAKKAASTCIKNNNESAQEIRDGKRWMKEIPTYARSSNVGISLEGRIAHAFWRRKCIPIAFKVCFGRHTICDTEIRLTEKALLIFRMFWTAHP